jgi:hypothetical protein
LLEEKAREREKAVNDQAIYSRSIVHAALVVVEAPELLVHRARRRLGARRRNKCDDHAPSEWHRHGLSSYRCGEQPEQKMVAEVYNLPLI